MSLIYPFPSPTCPVYANKPRSHFYTEKAAFCHLSDGYLHLDRLCVYFPATCSYDVLFLTVLATSYPALAALVFLSDNDYWEAVGYTL
jgi:hypothetical protein